MVGFDVVLGFAEVVFGCGLVVVFASFEVADDFGATDFGATDFGATDFDATDFDATDFGATDFDATDFDATDFDATGFDATDDSAGVGNFAAVATVDFEVDLLAAMDFAVDVTATFDGAVDSLATMDFAVDLLATTGVDDACPSTTSDWPGKISGRFRPFDFIKAAVDVW